MANDTTPPTGEQPLDPAAMTEIVDGFTIVVAGYLPGDVDHGLEDALEHLVEVAGALLERVLDWVEWTRDGLWTEPGVYSAAVDLRRALIHKTCGAGSRPAVLDEVAALESLFSMRARRVDQRRPRPGNWQGC